MDGDRSIASPAAEYCPARPEPRQTLPLAQKLRGVASSRRRPGSDPYRGRMPTQVVVLNGGSSSGKSGIIRCLQAILPDPWLATGVDRLIEAMPVTMRSAESIDFAADGTV